MTGIDTGTALLILVVFVLPGFVAVLVRERIYEVRIEETTYDRLLTSVYSSLLIWSVPLLFAIVAGAGREDHSVRTSWDFVFASDENVLLLVTLRDGERLGGFYGSRSHAAYGTRARDLFLEQRWLLDDGSRRLVGPSPNNLGMWINAQDIVSVERYALAHGLAELGQAEGSRQA